MKFKMLTFFSVLSLIEGCTLGMEHPLPSVDVGPSSTDSDGGWMPYQISENISRKYRPQKVFSNAESAWNYPPAPSPIRDDLLVKPIADMDRKPLPDISSSVGVAASPNVASANSLWVDRYVPAVMRERFDKAATEASYRGSSVVVDEETGNHFVMSRIWQAGKCSGVDINLMSPGGKLPVISRGRTEICS